MNLELKTLLDRHTAQGDTIRGLVDTGTLSHEQALPLMEEHASMLADFGTELGLNVPAIHAQVDAQMAAEQPVPDLK